MDATNNIVGIWNNKPNTPTQVKLFKLLHSMRKLKYLLL